MLIIFPSFKNIEYKSTDDLRIPDIFSRALEAAFLKIQENGLGKAKEVY
jgi:hypothetical protein